MAFSLKKEDKRTLYGDDEFVIEGRRFKLYLNDPNERYILQKEIGLEDYRWFHEQTGNRNWVLYNPKHYKISKDKDLRDILVFNVSEYDGTRLEVPINASSLCGLFSWVELPENFQFTSVFDTSNIVDTSLMFAGTTLPRYFSFGTHFHTHNVKDMHYMFYYTKVECPIHFNFDTKKVENMNHMYAHARIKHACEINLNTASVTNQRYMFHKTRFMEHPLFGDQFEISEHASTESMFLNTTLKGKTAGRELVENGKAMFQEMYS
ncbi:MAG: BspA family leucine-rich repeat surface protein [Eubacteriales bacterium]|nr:BspA family leucine-rich repeat surface protein [Eubacteriales bacterium]